MLEKYFSPISIILNSGIFISDKFKRALISHLRYRESEVLFKGLLDDSIH